MSIKAVIVFLIFIAALAFFSGPKFRKIMFAILGIKRGRR